VRAANQLASDDLVPDVTIFLDLSIQVGLVRAGARGGGDRMELAGDDFHSRVEGAFRTFILPEWQNEHPECGPIVRVDASGLEEEVFARVVDVLTSTCPDIFAGLAIGSRSI
jgi:dTMP kinase